MGRYLADSKISALPAASVVALANEFAINEAGVNKKLSMQQITDFLVKRISGPTGDAGPYYTHQMLAVDSIDNTTTDPDDPNGLLMTTNVVGPGSWNFKYLCRVRSAASTTGFSLIVRHTGSTPFTAYWVRFLGTGTAATTGIIDNVAGTGPPGDIGQIFEGYAANTMGGGGYLIGVAASGAANLCVIEGWTNVSVSGSLELRISSEIAASGVRCNAGTNLELLKIA